MDISHLSACTFSNVSHTWICLVLFIYHRCNPYYRRAVLLFVEHATLCIHHMFYQHSHTMVSHCALVTDQESSSLVRMTVLLLAWLTGFTYNNTTNIGSNPTTTPLFDHHRKWWYFEGGGKFFWSPSCVPEKVGVNQNGVNKKWYFHNKKYLIKQTNQPKSVKPKMRGRK